MNNNYANWEVMLHDGTGEPDPEFLSRLEQTLLLMPDQSLLLRVRSADLWDIIKAVLLAHNKVGEYPKDEMKPWPRATETEIGIFRFKCFLNHALPKARMEEYEAKFHNMVDVAQEKLVQAKRDNDMIKVKEAALIWGKILEILGETDESKLFD